MAIKKFSQDWYRSYTALGNSVDRYSKDKRSFMLFPSEVKFPLNKIQVVTRGGPWKSRT
jgi:hypothetical protein